MTAQFQYIPKKGNAFDQCASISDDYICCNFHVLRAIHNCPFKCTYCFLQDYLTNSDISVVNDIDALVNDVKATVLNTPNQFFRIGTWELGDSLVFENETHQAEKLIHAFQDIPNALLDFRTKSDQIDPLLSIQNKGKTTISWTLSPDAIIKSEEHGTACLKKRLAAMKKVVDAGYLITLHFDPMILYPDWEQGYHDLIQQVFEIIPSESIAWISIGSLRFNPEMKKKIEKRFPKSTITAYEMITGNDGKMRYVKPLRLNLYQHLYQAIQKYSTDNILIHLCMERWDVWEKIFKDYPKSTADLDVLITKSLATRFPGLVPANCC